MLNKFCYTISLTSRCNRAGYKCEGYDALRVKLFVPQTSAALLSPSYGSPTELQALRFYLTRSAPMIAMYTDSKEFWTIVVPQASWVYPQVRHAMTAISLTDQHLASGETNFDTELRVPKASYHYGQAIKGLMDDNACDKACMMATAMLLFTFEHINGDYNSSG